MNLNLEIAINLSMEVINLLGEVVFDKSYGNLSTGNQTLNIDLGSVANGIYQMRFLTELGQVVSRMEVIR
ncbi:MAG: T9SS type A sorting domain-containing protein [Flavobacteriales bacterium]|nr:T9SS type A sorting domain-containing protein [Flavobacteriales bacterium]